MAKGESESGGGAKVLPEGTRMALAITLLVVAVIAALYFAYYRNQVAYYTGRDLRLLSMLTAQIDGRVDMFSGFVENFTDAKPPQDVTIRSCATQNGAAPAGVVRRGIEQGPNGWRLSFERAGATGG